MMPLWHPNTSVHNSTLIIQSPAHTIIYHAVGFWSRDSMSRLQIFEIIVFLKEIEEGTTAERANHLWG